jgi:soluble lytic murein transglycosylase
VKRAFADRWPVRAADGLWNRRRAGRSGVLALAFVLAMTARAEASDALSAKDQPIVARAFEAADRDQLGKAEEIAAGATDRLPLKILQWLDLLRPQAGHSFAEIAAFIEANPDWPHQSTLRARAEESIGAVPDTVLRAWYEHHKPATALGRLKQAEFAAADGHADEAQRQIRDVWINSDFSGADEQLILARYSDTIRPEDQTARLDRLLWDGKGGDAERLLERVPEEWRLLADARLKLAASAKTAEAAVARVPASLQSNPGLLYERMRWRRRADQDDAALEIFDQAKELGRPEKWWPDRQLLARHLLEQNQAARAYKLITAHGLSDGPALADAEFTAGWIALRFFHDPPTGLGHFTRLYASAKLPLTLSRAAYWAGRSAEAMGQPDVALGWYGKSAGYTTTYYGQLAGAMPNVPPPAKPEPEPKASAQELQAFNKKDIVRATRILAEIGEDDRLKTFLNCLSENAQTPSDHALVADLAEEIGRPDLGVMAAKKASYVGVSLLRAGYPVVDMPRNAGAEQALLLALTRQESAFDLHAVSGAGARGLMQLMPGTARTVATKMLQLPYKEAQLTSDGTYNVTLGQAYMDSLLSSFNGSYLLSIAAYNAGPGRVRQWIDEFGDPRSPDVDAVDWVEQIPFTETRNYVQRVLENLQVYRLRIGNRSLAFSLETDMRR